MTKLRYAVAALFFAVSVGCLALWWRSHYYRDATITQNRLTAPARIGTETYLGTIRIVLLGYSILPTSPWEHNSQPINDRTRQLLSAAIESHGRFQGSSSQLFFPLWYPALIFALAGVGVLRFRRQFSVRSALVATTVVAALIGMAVFL